MSTLGSGVRGKLFKDDELISVAEYSSPRNEEDLMQPIPATSEGISWQAPERLVSVAQGTKRYRLKWDFSKHKVENWTGDFVRLFGPKNEGAIVSDKSAEDAKKNFAEENHLNPFYLTVELE